MDEAHDVSFVNQLKTTGEALFGNRNTLVDELKQLRFLQHKVDIPEAYRKTTQEVRNPLGADMLMRIVAQLTTKGIQFECPPDGLSEEAGREASKRERFLNVLIPTLERQRQRNIFRRGVDSQAAYGSSCIKVLLRNQYWATRPTSQAVFGKPAEKLTKKQARELEQRVTRFKLSAKLPFHMVDVAIETVYPFYDEDGLAYVVEVSRRPSYAVRSFYQLTKLADGRIVKIGEQDSAQLGEALPPDSEGGWQDTVEVIEFWSRKRYLILVEGHPVDMGEHPYQRPPYFFAEGLETSDNRPEFRSLSVLYNMRESLKQLDQLLTMKTNASYLYSYPTPFVRYPVEKGLNGEPKQVSWTPGMLWIIDDGGEPGFLKLDHVGADLNEMIQVARTFIQASGLSPVAAGQPIGADTAGYTVNQLTIAARLAYDPIIKNAETQWSEIGSFFLYLIDAVLDEDVYVYEEASGPEGKQWLALGPKDVQGYYRVVAHIDPLLPSNEVVMEKLGYDQWRGGGISWRTYQEQYRQNPAPDEEEVLMIAETIKKRLMEQGIIDQVVLRRSGIADLLRQQQPPAPAEPGASFGLVDHLGNPLQGQQLEQTFAQAPGVPRQPGIGMEVTPAQPQPPTIGFAGSPGGVQRLPPTQPQRGVTLG